MWMVAMHIHVSALQVAAGPGELDHGVVLGVVDSGNARVLFEAGAGVNSRHG
jgi:hypothetical protein